MNRKKSILISLTGITVVMLALLGLTYGYYITNIIGNTNSNSISIDTKDLKLVYNDGTEDLVFGAIEPGWTNSDEPKVFTVNNTGKSNIDEYAVGIDEVINTLNRTEDLVYTITCKSYLSSAYEADGDEAEENGVCRGNSGEFPKENSLILTNQIDSGYIHVYEMVISYKYLDDVNQSEDMGASVGGRIQIYTLPDTIDITGTVTGYSEGDYVEISTPTKTSQIVDGKYKLIGVEPGNHTLSIKYLDENDVVQTRSSKQISVRMGEDAGVSDNTITMNSTSGNVTININGSSSSLSTDITGVSVQTKLLKNEIIANAIKNTNSNSPTGTIYSPTPLTVPGQEISGENERTLSITEDASGSTHYFRGNVQDNYVNFGGMCWRIVRIQGDDTIKLVLADENNECDDSESNDKNGNGSYYSLTNISSALINGGATYSVGTFFNSFYNANILVNTTSNWFVNKGLASKDENTYIYSDKIAFSKWCDDQSIMEEYEGALGVETYFGPYKRLNDINNAQPSLKCDSIGILSGTANLYDSYMGVLTADEVVYAGSTSINGNNSFYLYSNASLSETWSLSTWMYTAGNDGTDGVCGITGDGTLGVLSFVYGTAGLRPSISLISNITISGGNGTQTNPYVIE